MELPDPPDLAALVEAYDNPTGTAEPENAACLARQALDRVQTDRLEPLRDLLVDGLKGLQQRLQDHGMPTATTPTTDESEPDLRGLMLLQRICRGWDPAATTPDAQTNGSIDLNALVEGRALRPVVWGQATACRGRIGSGRIAQVNLYLDASLQLFLYRGLTSGGETTFLLKVQGAYGTEAQRRPVDLDFRVSASATDLRLARTDGYLVASVGDGQIELRTRDRSYVFDPSTAACP
jgi:hypothetical protein